MKCAQMTDNRPNNCSVSELGRKGKKNLSVFHVVCIIIEIGTGEATVNFCVKTRK